MAASSRPYRAIAENRLDRAYEPHPTNRLSVAQAAARAGVSSRTIKRWIAANLLPATRLPSPRGKGHLRIRLGDVEALLARGTLG
jgi:excisionase family DNA binding protein